MSSEEVLLADIGNTHLHLYDGRDVTHLFHREALEKYAEEPLRYISVKHSMEKMIVTETNWRDISSLVVLEGAYDTMGVDRRALCLSHRNGLFVDAGSAITVDLMEGGSIGAGSFFRDSMRHAGHMRVSPLYWIEN